MNRTMLSVFTAGILAIGCCAPAAAAPFSTGKRFAVVIGNSSYPGTLLPGRADAAAMANELTQLGFTVVGSKPGETAVVDADRKKMLDALEALKNAIQRSGEVPEAVLFYFSGHGFQAPGSDDPAPMSYLLPLHAPENISDPDGDALSIESVIEEYLDMADLASRKAAKIVILDACRSNAALRVRGAKPTPGLPQKFFSTPSQTMIFYAASYNSTADGAPIDGNSPFTHFLLQRMDEAGSELRTVLTDAADDTKAHTNHQQPTDDGTVELPKPFYFRAPIPVAVEIDDADDHVTVTAGRGNTLEKEALGPPAKDTFYLHHGETSFLIQVLNQKTYRLGQTFNMPEGWFYKVTLTLPGQAPRVFTRCENVSDKDGPRFGKQFAAESVKLIVTGGQVTMSSPWRLSLPPDEREDVILETLPGNIRIGGRASQKADIARCATAGTVARMLFEAAGKLVRGEQLDQILEQLNREFTACAHGNIWVDAEPNFPPSCCDKYGC